MGKSIYNRALFPRPSILSQLFVLVWWSSIDSSVGEQRIWSKISFSLFCFALHFPFCVSVSLHVFSRRRGSALAHSGDRKTETGIFPDLKPRRAICGGDVPWWAQQCTVKCSAGTCGSTCGVSIIQALFTFFLFSPFHLALEN